MAASGKKNKKNKWKQVDLGTVLQETRPVAWAEEVEIDERELQLAAARKSALPTAPRSARGTDDERVPNSPPYVAYITNIPFETIEEDIEEFFRDLQLENIRLPRNDATGKLKGYGYVEFTERAGLIEALQIADTSMKGRRIRIDVSENNDRDRGYGRSDRMGMGRDRMGMGRDREDDPERTMGDWRSGPRSEPSGEDRMRSGGRPGFGGFGDREEGQGQGRERNSGFGAPRETDMREGGWREGMGSGTSGSSFGDRDRDRDSFRSRGFGDRDRDGGGSRFGDRGGDRYGGDRYGDRGGDRGGFERGGDRDGDRPRYGGDRDGDRYGDRPRYGGDREEGSGGDRFPRRDDGPPSESSGEPRARPKLQLQPRTRPVEVIEASPEDKREKELEEREKLEKEKAKATQAQVPRASIFGAAKPVDTAARERAIEERLAKEKDRAPRRDDQDKGQDSGRSRSREGNDEDDTKKVEPAPPPKENAWSRRPRLDDASSNNGDAKVDGRETSDNEGNDNKADRGRDRNHINNKEWENSDRKREEYRDNRTNRSGSRDKQDLGHEKEDGSNTDRYERKAGRGRNGPHGSQRGMGHVRDRVDRVAIGGGAIKGRQTPDRPARRDHSNEDRRLPKYEEKPQPNFVASNKYAFLNEDDQDD